MPTDDSTDDSGWLLYHSVGRFPGQQAAIAEALAGFTDVWCQMSDARWEQLIDARRTALDTWGGLVGAPAGSVFAAENVTQAFAQCIGALPDKALCGRRILIAEDCFPSLYFLLTGLAERRGFMLDMVPLRPGAAFVEDEDFCARWQGDVALALITYVSSTASKRADLHTLVAHGRSRGSLIAVDVTQAVGILPIDVDTPAVDIVLATSLKWLCGVPGAGMAYLRPALAQQLRPSVRGWFSQPDPFNWALDRFEFADDARRFDSGTPSYLPFIASFPGLAWVVSQGVEQLRKHNLALSHQLLEVADAHRLQLLSPRVDEQRGGSVMVAIPRAVDAAQLQRQLAAQGLITDTRGDCMRWSPGPVTRATAIERLHAALKSALPR
ncbi:aminotransferase class V-fold PLP-dependent enzyme [Verminephrobacter eiseniae]|uniref:aminotransferase class V-fold PLP-dependent enzyme n=1 Tax=Verminephrobacter eiseniae TaxID=364317 RepID=UPI002237D0A8|nr:aminotransferase class V-fold PLP-dependent enzyme [Verminephrobacter eiseniae]MCW5262901.1 aminotransferase class V-fold PLP-dependent enzyme [Verminephrobacter eiseniae]